MAILTTHRARVMHPLGFSDNGTMGQIPSGPCFVDEEDGGSIAIVWGENGESKARLTALETGQATVRGCLVLLD